MKSKTNLSEQNGGRENKMADVENKAQEGDQTFKNDYSYNIFKTKVRKWIYLRYCWYWNVEVQKLYLLPWFESTECSIVVHLQQFNTLYEDVSFKNRHWMSRKKTLQITLNSQSQQKFKHKISLSQKICQDWTFLC